MPVAVLRCDVIFTPRRGRVIISCKAITYLIRIFTLCKLVEKILICQNGGPFQVWTSCEIL